MTRFYHFIKHNKETETINQCIFVDTETTEVPRPKGYTGHVLRFGWAAFTQRTGRGEWTKPEWKKFTTYDEFWLWALSFARKKKKLWMWCHNSSFDYPVLHAFSHLPKVGWKLKSAIIDAPPTIVRYKMDKMYLVLCDTLNLWRMPLKALGKMVGLEKLVMPKEWTDNESDDAYCQRDVAIIMKAVCDWTNFLIKEDMGSFFPTIAGQAMRTFRHKYMDDKIMIDANVLALKVARNCYHGGRVECGFIGKYPGKVVSLDVNSMYPYVMSYCRMPIKLAAVSRFYSVQRLKDICRDYCVCAYVRVHTDEPFAAVLHQGKLVFPVGDFDAYLTTPELTYALERGFIVSVHLAAAYEPAVAFRRFALDLYQHKQSAVLDGRPEDAFHWKILLNSFYGKWGQNGRVWKEIGTCNPELFETISIIHAQTNKITHRRKFGGLILERFDEAESGSSHPAIAAHITAEARMVLWALIRELTPPNYLYCDTDGILTTEAGIDKLANRIDQSALGKLKHVATYNDVRINGAKDLILDGKRTLKGVRDTAKQLDERVFEQIKWTSLTGQLRAGSVDMPLTIPVTKTLSGVYNKGIIGSEGWVSPLHYSLPITAGPYDWSVMSSAWSMGSGLAST